MRLAATLALALLLVATLVAPAHAEPFRAGQLLDQEQVAQVAGAALAFMAPRLLDPIPCAQLTLWGLRGLTTLDSRLAPAMTDTGLALTLVERGAQRTLLAMPAPPADDAAGWAAAAAAMIRAGWNASAAVRAARTQGVIRTFFDELFNHLDPYSRYAPPTEAADELAADRDTAGIGLELGTRGDAIVVRRVAAGSPAARAGIRVGDALLAIDGDDVAGDDPQAVQASLQGAADSDVALTVRHPGWAERTLRLARVPVASDTVQARRDGPALVLRVTAFAYDTGALLARALQAGLSGAAGGRVRGLVLDLRDNRGGVLGQAAVAASALMAQGIVASTDGRDPEAAHVFRAEGPDVSRGLPLVVLVDGRTASAAEILAAALADQRRAVVVGSATLGKGVVQAVDPLPDGGALFVTWSRVLAPLGWPIQGLGVLPQVCTSLGPDAARRQLAELEQGRQPMAAALARARAARPPVTAAEALDIRMACPAALGRDVDRQAADTLLAHPEAYAAALLGPDTGSTPPVQ